MTDKTPLTAHAGSRSWELRFGDEVMARVSTTFTMQAEFAQQVTLRYNAHEGLLAAARAAEAQIKAWRETGVPDISKFMDAQDALRAAIAKAEGRKP